MKIREIIAWGLLLTIGGVGLVLSCQGPATADAATCPVTGAGPYQSCILMPSSSTPEVGQQVTTGQGANPGTPWMITDPSGAPMAWVNLYGLYSGGQPGFPGGLICTTRGLDNAACLTPDRGTLELFDAHGENPVTLTRADIIWLHRHEG